MSIIRFIRQGINFDDATTHAMGEAFDAACAEQSDPSENVRELMALQIIEAAKNGERDPGRLKRAALITFDR